MSELKNIKREKVILHIDGDAFFVGVEVAKNPILKGKAVVTGQERGIVSALSYEAKALGIVRGMPIFKLKRNFPEVIVLPGDYKSYLKYSRAMINIVRRYADDVEEYSIDECFAELTGLDKPLKMTYLEIAKRIKKEVNEELGLSVTLGLAPTKVLAKVASNWVKPNGLTVINKEQADNFLKDFPIEKIWGIGKRTKEKLNKKGVMTAYDFSSKDLFWIRDNFSKPYEYIWNELNGISVMKLNPEIKSKYSSIQKTRTFHPATSDKNFLLGQLSKHIEEVCVKARKYKLAPKKFSFFLKKSDLKYSFYSYSLPAETNAPEVLMAVVKEKFSEVYNPQFIYRATGVVLQELVSSISVQNTLFESVTKANKFEVIHQYIDNLENKIGKHVVHLGSTQSSLSQMTEYIDFDSEEKSLLFT